MFKKRKKVSKPAAIGAKPPIGSPTGSAPPTSCLSSSKFTKKGKSGASKRSQSGLSFAPDYNDEEDLDDTGYRRKKKKKRRMQALADDEDDNPNPIDSMNATMTTATSSYKDLSDLKASQNYLAPRAPVHPTSDQAPDAPLITPHASESFIALPGSRPSSSSAREPLSYSDSALSRSVAESDNASPPESAEAILTKLRSSLSDLTSRLSDTRQSLTNSSLPPLRAALAASTSKVSALSTSLDAYTNLLESVTPYVSLLRHLLPSLYDLRDAHLSPRATRYTPPEDTGELDEFGRRKHLTDMAAWKAGKGGPWDDPLLEAARLLTSDVDAEFLSPPVGPFEEFRSLCGKGYDEVYAGDALRSITSVYELMRVLGCIDIPAAEGVDVEEETMRDCLDIVKNNIRTGDLREAGRWLKVLEGVDLAEDLKGNVWWGKGEDEGEWREVVKRAGYGGALEP